MLRSDVKNENFQFCYTLYAEQRGWNLIVTYSIVHGTQSLHLIYLVTCWPFTCRPAPKKREIIIFLNTKLYIILISIMPAFQNLWNGCEAIDRSAAYFLHDKGFNIVSSFSFTSFQVNAIIPTHRYNGFSTRWRRVVYTLLSNSSAWSVNWYKWLGHSVGYLFYSKSLKLLHNDHNYPQLIYRFGSLSRLYIITLQL